MTMHLAAYKGPPETAQHWAVHVGICIATFSRYSHIELVIDGVCWTASSRDGGVRPAVINLESGRWDVFPVDGDKAKALAWFLEHKGERYDWSGVLRVSPLLRRVLPKRPHKRFCSEAVAAALGHPDPESLSPQGVVDLYARKALKGTQWLT